MDISKAIDKAAGAEREIIGSRPLLGHAKRMKGGNFVDQGGKEETEVHNFTAPSTPEAKQWQGWGTALKPASEHWILVRKPLEHKHTVAANVLKHGTGGINIDASRIATDRSKEREYDKEASSGKTGSNKAIFAMGDSQPRSDKWLSTGRFPANLVLSHNPDCEETCSEVCAVAMLDEQSGILKSGALLPGHKQHGSGQKEGDKYSYRADAVIQKPYGGDSGGASRFFYVAKASKADKNAGCGTNGHPTVKSTKLMSYLIKLITPPQGVVLDPFMGSGSTGVAAIKEGFMFIGIEKELEYFTISEKRLDKVS